MIWVILSKHVISEVSLAFALGNIDVAKINMCVESSANSRNEDDVMMAENCKRWFLAFVC